MFIRNENQTKFFTKTEHSFINKDYIFFIYCREAELIKHVQQLEEQLQKMIQNRSQDTLEVSYN